MYRFLIVDDEPVVREGIAQNIDWADLGFDLVGACGDGREALREIERLQPDVVLTDICMPFVDGLELATVIVERFPGIKTILLTGYDEFEYAQEAVKLKVSDFLLKPITPEEIRALLRSTRQELDGERQRRRQLARLEQQVKESLPVLRERFLSRLVRSAVDPAELTWKLSLLEINLPGPAFAVLICDLDGVSASRDLTALSESDNIIGMFCSNEGTVVGVLAATNDGAQLATTYDGLVVVGYDAGEAQKNAVRQQYFLGSITQDPYQIGYKAVELAYKAANGESVSDVDTGAKFYDHTNMDEPDIARLLYD